MTKPKKEKRTPRPFDATGRWVLFATISASSMAFLMQSALNVAVPAIQADFGATGLEQVWIVNAYQLVLSALIMLGGSLGDLYGRKRVYMTGIVLFTVACVTAGLSPTTEILIAARAFQGLGGALMVPGSLAIISSYFDDETRGRAIGTWTAFTTALLLVAPLLGGALADLGLWRGIFFLCVPLAVMALYALVLYVPESRDEEGPRNLDIPGAILITLALAGIVYGTTELGRGGVQTDVSPLVPASIIGGIIALLIFILVEARSSHPIIPLRLFRSRTFSAVNIQTLLLYGSIGGAFFFLTLNLQQIQGYTATIAGVATLPITVLLMLLSPWAGGLLDRYGPRLPLTLGPILMGTGFLLLAFPGVTEGPADYWLNYFPGLVIGGMGFGVTVAPLTTTALGAVPQHNAGVASGVNNLMARAAGSLALSIMGGLALILFTGNLERAAQDIPLPESASVQLMANSVDLGGTQVPASLDDERLITEVRGAIDTSFVDMFRVMALIAVGMCALSALLGAFVIEPELRPQRKVAESAAD